MIPSNITNEGFWQMLSKVQEAVYAVDTNLRLIYMNSATKTIGFQPDRDLGQSIFTVFPKLNKEKSLIIQVLESGRAVINQRITFINYRGERKTTLTSTYPLIQGNKLVGVFEIFEDVSAIHEYSNKMLLLQQLQNKSVTQPLVDIDNQYSDTMILDHSPAIQNIKEQIPIISKYKSPIFIYGETGTGKELLVQSIHESTLQEKAPFIAQNCAAIPETLLEGILFGTEKGGFTGAENRPGLFELAHKGTLFLDEINSMPLTLQAKLLRVLQEKKVRRIGSQKEISIDVRIVAATNVHPSIILQSGELRSDLYYRLNVIYLELPSLRERKEDIPELVQHFIHKYNKEFHKNILGVSKETLNFFTKYDWPGNIRELQNLIERAMNIAEDGYIQLSDIQTDTLLYFQSKQPTPSSTNQRPKLREAIIDLEIQLIKEELIQQQGNISKAARRLDIPQQTLNNKIQKYQLRSFVYEIKASTQK